MAKLFISYSTKDKEFTEKLAKDLRDLAHDIFLDSWSIKVGESIPTRIEQGLQDSDFVVVVLSPDSVNSGWVESEWKTKYWEEIQTKQVKVLPILLADCEIPILLKTKKFADFRTNYLGGLFDLNTAVSVFISASGLLPETSSYPNCRSDQDISR